MESRRIQLPEDTNPHDTIIEWWYFNGHLTDEKGRQYSFMDCLFRADLAKVEIPYLKNFFGQAKAGRHVTFAHAALTDIGRRKNYKDIQNISIASRDSFKKALFYARYIDPVAVSKGTYEIAEIKPGTFHIKTDRIDLVLVSKKRPMLEGGKGFITVRRRESFYYSLTNFETTGKIRIGKKWISVSGKSWMDHQWANTPYAKDKWTWFSIQLDDGTDLMCVAYDDGKGKDYIIDVLNAHGAAADYRTAQFKEGKKAWKSKVTNVSYPLAWTIAVPGKKIKLKTSALVRDGEMIFGTINYWEGPIEVQGMIGRKKVRGVGYMELAGYPSNYNLLSRLAGLFK